MVSTRICPTSHFAWRLLGTSMLALPATTTLIGVTPSYATCTVTSGGGSLTTPDNGATVTCDAVAVESTPIGDGTTSATVLLDDDAVLNITGGPGGPAITLQTATVDMRDGSAVTGNTYGVFGNTGVGLTAGNDTNIVSNSGIGLAALANDVVAVFGNNATIDANTFGISSAGNIDVTAGTNLSITGGVSLGLYAGSGTATLRMGDDGTVTSAFEAVAATGGVSILGGGDNITITSGSRDAINSPTDDVVVTLGSNADIGGDVDGIDADQAATVIIGAGSNISATNGHAIIARNASITLTPGAGSTLDGGTDGVSAATDIDILGGANTVTITGTDGYGVYSSNNDVAINLGSNATIYGGIVAIGAAQNIDLTVGADSSITADDFDALNAINGSATLTLGSGTTVMGEINGIMAADDVTILGSGDTVAIIGTTGDGIFAANNDVMVTLGDNASITGATNGIDAAQSATVTVGANATIIGTNGRGIYAPNDSVTLSLGAGSSISGRDQAIMGSVDVSIAGGADDVTITGSNGPGVYAANNDLSLDLGANATITGNDHALFASQAADITVGAGSTITGTTGRGIFAANDAASLTPGTGSSITGATDGILGSTNVSVLGGADNVTIEGTTGYGVNAANNDIMVNLGANAHISGADGGVIGSGSVSATLGGGSIIESSSGPAILSLVGSVIVTPGAGSRITGSTVAVDGRTAVSILGGADNVTIAATGGFAILASAGDLRIDLGANTLIESSIFGMIADQNVDISVGADSLIESLGFGGAGISSVNGLANVNLGPRATIAASGVGISDARNVTLGLDGRINSTTSTGILGTIGDDTIDLAGSVSGLVALDLNTGNDTLILRSGASLDGIVDGRGGSDTIQLMGSGSEDEAFVDFETLEMNGAAWTLSGNSDIDDTVITSGALNNAGTLTSNVDVQGGTFQGTGTTIGNVTNSGGTLAPGNSIGTQTITGNFAQGAGGMLAIEFDEASADLLDISGTAALDGTLSFTGPPTIADGDVQTFLQAAGGITGDFANVTDNLLFFETDVAVGPTAVTVTFDQLNIAQSPAAETSSERNAAATLDRLIAGNAELSTLINGLPTFAAASDVLASQGGLALSAITDATAAAIQHQGQMALRLATLNGARHPERTGSTATGTLTGTKIEYWTDVTTRFGEIEDDSNARGFDYRIHGVSAGAQAKLPGSTNTKFGLFAAISGADSGIDSLNDDADSEIYQAGVYAGHELGLINLSSTASLAWIDLDTNRQTSIG